MLLPATGWAAGIAVARVDGIAWQVMCALAGTSILIALYGLFRKTRLPGWMFACFLIGGFVWGWVSLVSDAARFDTPAGWQDRPIRISAMIVAMQRQSAGWRLSLGDVQRDDGQVLAGKLWLYVYPQKGGEASNPVGAWLPGDRIEADAVLHVPRNHHNPSGFNFMAWCFDRHIALLGSARGEVRRLSAGSSRMEHVRQRIRQGIEGIPEARGGVIRALLLGERQAIPESVYNAFASTGAAHLLAISGLHVGLVAGLGFSLIWWLLTRRESCIVYLPVRGIALAGGVLLAMLYAQLAGWPLPTQRAAMMLAAAALAWWLRARAAPLNVLLAALMLILLLDASAITSLSLWLSFTATAGILLWAGKAAGDDSPVWRRRVSGLFVVTLLAWLATLPLVADVFGRLPVYSLPANLLATPLYTLFVLPFSLAGALLAAIGWGSGAHALFSLAAQGIGVGNQLLDAICHWPASGLWLPDIPWWLSALYALGMAGCAWLITNRRRAGALLLLCLTLSAYSAVAISEGNVDASRLIAWDVGQGSAISLTLRGGQVMVVDAAGRPGARFNAGVTMAEGLRGMGLTHIDVLVISHDQSDHAGGVLSLVKRMNHIGELWLADVPATHRSRRIGSILHAVAQRGGTVRWLRQGDEVVFAGAKTGVLWPPAGWAASNGNNDSLVLHLRLPRGLDLLLPGDIETPVEQSLLEDGRLPACDVLLVPHHGSATSSTTGFIAALAPSIAIAQTGFANRYGFPVEVVRQRYREAGSRLFDTSGGAVMLAVDAAMDSGGQPGAQLLETPRIYSERRNRALQWWRHFL